MLERLIEDSDVRAHVWTCLIVMIGMTACAALLGWFWQADGGIFFLAVAMAWALVIPIALIVLVVTSWILVRAGLRIAKRSEGTARHIARWSAPIMLPMTAILTVFAPGRAADLHRDRILSANIDRFEQYAVQAGEKEGKLTLTNGEEIAVAQDGERIFFFITRLGDNGQGFVRDPSGEVALARGWLESPGVFSAPPHIRELFGGDLVICEHVRGDYFYCSIT